MSNLLFGDDRQTDPTGYDAALHSLAAYMDDEDACEDLEELRIMALMWDARKCACGDCEDCWLFTSHRGAMSPLSFWVHGPKVMAYSMMGPSNSIVVTHDLVAH